MTEHVLKTQSRSVPWAHVAQFAIVVSLVAVFIVTVRDLRGYHFTVLPRPYAASLVLGLGAVLSLFFLWYRLIARVSHQHVPFFGAMRIFAYTWLGRYLPGRIWSSVGKVFVGSRFGLSAEQLTLASLLEQILSNMAHAVLALFFLLFLLSERVDSPAVLISMSVLVLGAGLLVLQPTVLGRIVNTLLKRLGCSPLEPDRFPSRTEIFAFALGYSLPLFLYGGSFWLVVVALNPDNDLSPVYLLAAFVVGSFIGKLSFVLPAGGIGVREAALVFLLQSAVGLPLAILASLISRLSLALIDVLFVSAVSAVERLGIVDA